MRDEQKTSTVKKETLDKVTKLAKDYGTSSYLGTFCRTWLYQPKVPQKLLDLDK